MEWPPQWVGEKYCVLYGRKGRGPYTFRDVKTITGLTRSAALKLIYDMDNRGLLISRRSELDRRKAEYYLISPEDLIYAGAIKYSVENPTPINKIKEAGKKVPYLLTGTTAAVYHHRYTQPAFIDIKVRVEDFEKWYALLRESDTFVIMFEETEGVTWKEKRRYKKLVRLLPKLTDEEFESRLEHEGLNIDPPETLIVDFLRKQDQPSITQALAILLVKFRELKWKRLLETARKTGTSRSLGFLLEVMNTVAGRELISKRLIKRLQPEKVDTFQTFPEDKALLSDVHQLESKISDPLISEEKKQKAKRDLQYYRTYEETGRKWGILSILPPHIIKKVLEDLAGS